MESEGKLQVELAVFAQTTFNNVEALAEKLRHLLCNAQSHPSDERLDDLLYRAAAKRALACSERSFRTQS